MAKFIMFGRFYRDAFEDIGVDRTEEAVEIIAKAGGELIATYTLLGEIEVVLVLDLPDVQTALKVSVELGKLIKMSFTTQPAFSAEESSRLFS